MVDLERPLPSLPVGAATAVFCLGSCFHRREAVAEVAVVVDGVRHRPTAFAMPRPDLLHSRGEPSAYRSGFWGTVPIEAHETPGTVELEVSARLASGTELVAPLGRVEIVEPERPRPPQRSPERSGRRLIAVCMATYEPDMALFRAQIESLRSQTDDGWVCLISDDCSSPDRFEQMRQAVGPDPRFALWRWDQRLGFYRNFERALRMAPAEAELVALCDQDDRWHPEKLEVLRGALGGAQLVYSDQRLVDAEGRVLRETLWQGRRNNHTNLASLLVANSITGAATLFRREVVELMLPFPESPGFQFHDHWLGLVALASGAVAYVDRPLYDYVQHAGAVFGDVTHGSRTAVRRTKLLDSWRANYFYGYLAREVQAQTLLVRCSTLSATKRRVLERFVSSDRSPAAFLWLAARPLRRLMGLNETLGTETELAQGILWRWLTGLRRSRGDASFPGPASFNQRRLRRWRARI